jgi:Lhr-like helicase
VNEALCEMIAAQIAKIDFGVEHSEAKKACATLNEAIVKVDHVINDSNHYINEVVSELKRRVDLKHELIKLKVEQATHSILDKLVEYETKCKEQAKNKINKMQAIKLATKNELDKWMVALNELKFDENVWRNIRGQSEIKTNQLLEALAVLKKELMMNQYEDKNEEIKHYENIDMDSLFVFE